MTRRSALVAALLAGFASGSLPWGCGDDCDLPERIPEPSVGAFEVVAAADPALVGATATVSEGPLDGRVLTIAYTDEDGGQVEVEYH